MDDDIISRDDKIAETMNRYFANIVGNLHTDGYQTDSFVYDGSEDIISNITSMCKDHPSIIKIRDVVNNTEPFRFIPVEEEIISEKLRHIDKKKASNLNGIPPKILVENYDILSPFLTKLINGSNSNMKFPDPLKLADISPIYKKDDATNKENY